LNFDRDATHTSSSLKFCKKISIKDKLLYQILVYFQFFLQRAEFFKEVSNAFLNLLSSILSVKTITQLNTKDDNHIMLPFNSIIKYRH
jgi:hypothetical protein